jgi:hypothetical protein
MMAFLFSLPLIFAMTPVVRAATTDGQGLGSPSDPYTTTATFPQTGVYCEAESAADPTCTITLTITGATSQAVNIQVEDGWLIGDEYYVNVDGSYLFTTQLVQQPTSTALCVESPAGNLASCAAAQAAGDIVQTYITTWVPLTTAQAAGLSVGDADITLTPGTHTITISDVSSSFTSDFGGDYYGAGFFVTFSSPPSPTVPQFPLGLPLLLGAAMVGLLLERKRILPDIKRTV